MIILLVEDNEGDIALTQIAFGDSGIDGELVVARDGAEAVDRLYGRGEFADAELPDLMLVDRDAPWRIDAGRMRAKAGNTPFDGLPVQGKVLRLFKGGAALV